MTSGIAEMLFIALIVTFFVPRLVYLYRERNKTEIHQLYNSSLLVSVIKTARKF